MWVFLPMGLVKIDGSYKKKERLIVIAVDIFTGHIGERQSVRRKN